MVLRGYGTSVCMSDLYPLLIQPQFHERVWGSRDLAPFYAQAITGDPIGESWLTGEECRVVNGPLAGRSLADLSAAFGRRLLGGAATDTSRFPLLVKFVGTCCARNRARRSPWD